MNTPADTVATATELKPKTRLTGKVVKTTLAGAIVDIGQAVPGILHISQLQSDPVKKVDEILQVGQSIDVWVRRAKADRIELTMLEPLGLDWKEIKPEMVIKGKVVRLETYGAFVEIGAERPGLVHISEMAHGYVKTPQEVVKEGDEIDVMVLDVDRKKKQIRLSIKATLPKPEEKEEVIEMPHPERKRSAKKSTGRGKGKSERTEMSAEPAEIEPTVFELAWKAALDRQKAEKAERAKKAHTSKQHDDIFERTLKNRLPTG
jgi:small subunit ribosomal protein S1